MQRHLPAESDDYRHGLFCRVFTPYVSMQHGVAGKVRESVKISIARFVLVALLLCGLLAVAVDVDGDTAQADDALPSRVERLRGLAEVWGMVHYFHPALADEGLQDAWHQAAMRAVSEVEQATSVQEYGLALQSLVSRLGDAYTQILPPGSDQLQRLPIRLCYEDGRTIVSLQTLDADGLVDRVAGCELLEVNGESVSDYLELWLLVASGENQNLRAQWVYDRLLSAAPGSETLLSLECVDGESTELLTEIPTASALDVLAPRVESSVVGNDVLWVRIPSLWSLADMVNGIPVGIDLSPYYEAIRGVFTRRATIIDFRSVGYSFGSQFAAKWLLPRMLGRFASSDGTRAIGMMQREHRGLVPEIDLTIPSYYCSGWRIRVGELMEEALGYRAPLVFLVDEFSYPIVMPYLASLQASGQAIVMGEAGSSPCYTSYSHELPGGISLFLRLDIPQTSEPDLLGIFESVSLDSAYAEYDEDRLLAAAHATIDAWDEREQALMIAPLELGSPLAADQAVAISETSRAGRLLGLFKVWNAVKYFYGYPERIDGDWDVLLEQAIPRVEAPPTMPGYALAIQQLLVHLSDAHAFVMGMPWMSPVSPWLEIREIEGKAVVISGLPIETDTGLTLELSPGQVILEINGEPVQVVLERILSSMQGATEAHRRFLAHRFLLTGVDEPEVELLILDELDEERLVQQCRTCRPPTTLKKGDAISYEEGVAYINLGLLTLAEYEAQSDEVWASDGIILDLRNGLRDGVFLALADLVYSEPFPYLQATVPVRATPDPWTTEWVTTLPRLSPGTSRVFGKPIVLIADVAATSAGETIAMMLQNSGRVVFVGETTSGTNGDVTALSLPFDLRVYFSGMAVHHPDGHPLQGIGINPDVEVRPSIQGIREGRDEVLEKGLEVLQEMMVARTSGG